MKIDQFVVDDFLQKWESGFLCLHPTDTIPGISFNPQSELAYASLLELKKRPANKTCICLVNSLSIALEQWAALPDGWVDSLKELWPGSLTVVWQAKTKHPLVRDDGTIALRCPSISAETPLIAEVLSKTSGLFPSTSVNLSGEPSFTDWKQAKDFLSKFQGNIFTPDLDLGASCNRLPSTIIKILYSGSYEMIREGALRKDQIDKVIEVTNT
ncbi:MAG: Sua5/YciO/YrdC/YwlC family protein [Pseudobacteriovorax sp.]|nr:Sua5/YciO/YrdC/YwlC family protein [Pseudobacteriovorax sp.]